MSMATEIRRRRRALDLTQAQLAERAGFSLAQINLWERGQIGGIRARNIAALERALDLQPAELMRIYCEDVDAGRIRDELAAGVRQ